eukprot:CAMPEP_0119486760 /NCGR_PEP_ID=MMETSP1344-20130328/13066_1 /TAXON_ID=236787 /ORGANISM="Florenciella parvula, Strain CCMP2471" /LENGTH=56 /DNA_ID=CAMNT_0007521551 /DNA_START=35 /DNA_END=202 /DNA_ORIENTATION=+
MANTGGGDAPSPRAPPRVASSKSSKRGGAVPLRRKNLSSRYKKPDAASGSSRSARG